jgi:predicted nuclease of predicted toxin-antitoxin system
MKILLDECLPVALKDHFASLGHDCETVRQAGFGAKKNGELITLAEGQWDVLVTNDRSIKYQQNMAGRNLAILILSARSNRMEDLLPLMPSCGQAILSIEAGQVVEVGTS